MQPPVSENLRGDYSGHLRRELNLDCLEGFKYAIEQHVQSLTLEVQTLQEHANWIEPRLHEFLKFTTWMQGAHPDIINAYKKSTAVAEKLDRANDEMSYPMSSPPEMMGS
jgi:hypothetical protein